MNQDRFVSLYSGFPLAPDARFATSPVEGSEVVVEIDGWKMKITFLTD